MSIESTPPTNARVAIDARTMATMRAEATARFERGEYDDDFDDCEDARSVPNTPENWAQVFKIFADHGFK